MLARIKRVVALYLMLFLAVSLLISLYINITSFRDQFINNELSFYSINGTKLAGNIEYGLLYGKSLDRYYGLDRLVDDWALKSESVVNVRILSADKQDVYYSMHADIEKIEVNWDDSLLLPIHSTDGKPLGYLNIVVDLSERLEVLNEKILMFIGGAGGLLLVGILVIIAFVRFRHFLSEDGRIDKKKLLVFLLTLIFLLQSAFTAYSYVALRAFSMEITDSTVKEVQELIADDLEKVLAQGVRYDQIYGFDEYAKEVVEQAPILKEISLQDEIVQVTVSDEYIEKIIQRMLFDMVTVLVTSIFIAAELVNYMIISINRKTATIHGIATYDRLLSTRVSSFLFYTASYLPISFIPVLMFRFTKGEASDFLLGLPIVVFFASSLIFTLAAGSISPRIGWKKLLFLGGILLAGSSMLAALISHPAALVFARAVYGASYAFIYVAIREFAVLPSDRTLRSMGLGEVTAGQYAGINIGAVLGSMLLETAGFTGVFLLSAVLATLGILVVKQHCLEEEGEKQ